MSKTFQISWKSGWYICKGKGGQKLIGVGSMHPMTGICDAGNTNLNRLSNATKIEKRCIKSLLSWWTKTMVTHHVWVRFFGISVESLSWIVLFQSTEIQSIFFGLNLRNKLISPKLIFSTFSFFGRDFKRTSRLLLDCSDDDNVRFF